MVSCRRVGRDVDERQSALNAKCFKDEGAVVVRSQQKENRSLAEARDRDLWELGLHQEWSRMNCLRMWLMGLSPMFLMNGLFVQESFVDR